MGLYTKKPVTIEAVRVQAADYNGFSFDGDPFSEIPEWIRVAMAQDVVVPVAQDTDYAVFDVRTIEGVMRAQPGDWIIRGVEGELYPCKDSVFQATYAVASRTPDSTGEPALSLAETQAVVETKTAPRITEASIKAKIDTVEYFRTRHLTICIITLHNGFFVTGKSAPAAPENYDQAVGERYAYENAFRDLWQLEGYLLRERLAQAEMPERAHDDLGRVA